MPPFLTRWRPTLLTLLGVTAAIALLVALVITGGLPLQTTANFSARERHIIRIFMGLAVSLGLLLPLVAWVTWLRHRQPRRLLGLYLLTLVVQIATEQVVSGWLFSSSVVIIGTIYTLLRLGQIGQSHQWVRQGDRPFPQSTWLLYLLRLLFGFWLCNLGMLLAIGWPSLLPGAATGP